MSVQSDQATKPREDAAGEEPHGLLPRGRHHLPREVVIENQRQRLIWGAGKALAEHGYSGASVGQIIEYARISRATFYEYFDNRRDCFLAAHETTFEAFTAQIFRACARREGWPEKVEAAVAAVLGFVAARPEEARLLSIEFLGSDDALAKRVLASYDYLAGLLRAGRDHYPLAAALPDLTERALVVSVSGIIGQRLRAGETHRLTQLQPPLVEFILAPYLGAEGVAARSGSHSETP